MHAARSGSAIEAALGFTSAFLYLVIRDDCHVCGENALPSSSIPNAMPVNAIPETPSLMCS